MKRICCLVIAFLLCVTMISTCFAEEVTIKSSDSISFYVIRPRIKIVFENGESSVLTFGTKVEIVEHKDEYTYVKTEDGLQGKVTTGFLESTVYPIIWIDKVGCYLSPGPGYTPSNFGYGLGGLRYEERAIIIFDECDGYYFVVTDEGYCGYISANDPHISLYTDQVPGEN